jgi:3-methyladenine DNA glycosylase AlkD
MDYKQIIARLQELGDPEKAVFKEKKYGIIAQNALGIYQKDLNALAKVIPQSDELAIQLFDSGIYEARILCSKLFNPQSLTEGLMEKWVSTFDNWEICDSFCMGLFAKSQWAVPKAMEWPSRTPEFEKRAGFVIMAAYCMADKKADNAVYESFLPLIKREATDERVYVKKAVNWALRNIGKRNIDLKAKAINCAGDILATDHKTARWIASHAIKALTKEGARTMDYPRHVYR